MTVGKGHNYLKKKKKKKPEEGTTEGSDNHP